MYVSIFRCKRHTDTHNSTCVFIISHSILCRVCKHNIFWVHASIYKRYLVIACQIQITGVKEGSHPPRDVLTIINSLKEQVAADRCSYIKVHVETSCYSSECSFILTNDYDPFYLKSAFLTYRFFIFAEKSGREQEESE